MNDCQNVIDDYGNPCGDEGRVCEDCMEANMREHAYLRGMPRYLVIDDQQSRDELAQELRDAGRAYL